MRRILLIAVFAAVAGAAALLALAPRPGDGAGLERGARAVPPPSVALVRIAGTFDQPVYVAAPPGAGPAPAPTAVDLVQARNGARTAAVALIAGIGAALAAMFATLMVFLSAAMDRQAPAAGAGIAVYVALFVLTGFPAVRDRTPAGLLAANDALLKGRHVALAAPLATTLVLAVLFVGAAVVAFRRKEL